ncbi:MAG: ParB/RepB/Spo0J family partition protein [Betaproteobacteria bacterium]|nr:ParB/RepB/Spo0J family partition protein [Betaproteobacteria bacterium]
MSLKDKLKAKSAGIGAAVDAEMANTSAEQKPTHPRTAIGQASAFQLAMSERDTRIAELEASLADADRSEIPVVEISPNPWQPRRIFNQEDIQKLADSIGEVGLIQPVVVRRKSVPTRDTFPGADAETKSVPSRDTLYELVAGERRWRAHQLLGLPEIKAIVIEVTDEFMALMALAENLDREDLTDYETSKAIRRAESEFKSRKRMAEAIGIGRQDFYKYLAFSALPEFILADLEVAPGLLGRNAAEQVVAALKTHGEKGSEALTTFWPQIKSGNLDQTKLASAIEASIVRGKTTRTDREIKKLFVGTEQAGSITRDASTLTIKIRTAALSAEQEDKLRAFVEGLLKS